MTVGGGCMNEQLRLHWFPPVVAQRRLVACEGQGNVGMRLVMLGPQRNVLMPLDLSVTLKP